jgi:hypothetical protein
MSPKKAIIKRSTVKDNSYDEVLCVAEEFAKNIQALNKQAVKQYAPLVNNLISTKCQNKKQIELIFKQSAAGYEKSYFEMWEESNETLS